MLCWSCKNDAGSPLCSGCGALQPLPPGLGHAQVLGLPQTFFLDAAALEARFRELNRALHPDRWAKKSPQERRASLEWTTAVNGAYRTLKDPLSRAAWLLKAQGLDIEREAGARPTLAPEFLEQVMEWREGLMEAKASGSLEAVHALAEEVRARQSAVEADLAEAMRRWESASERPALERAAQSASALRYFRRFQEEVEAIEQAALDAD